jgi:hypothetical protein
VWQKIFSFEEIEMLFSAHTKVAVFLSVTTGNVVLVYLTSRRRNQETVIPFSALVKFFT